MKAKQTQIEVSTLTEHELQQLYKALLIASCRLDPRDPVQFLKNTLTTFQGHDNLQNVDWDKFLSNEDQQSMLALLQLDEEDYMDSNELLALFYKYEKAYSCYRSNITRTAFRLWKNFTTVSMTDAAELAERMEIAEAHYDRKKQEVAFAAWRKWVTFKEESRITAVQKLARVFKACVLKRVMAAWRNIVRDSRKTKDYFKKLQTDLELERQQSQVGEGCDWLSALPLNISLKIFQYLELRDLLSCSEVCCSWKSLIHSSTLWSKVNVSMFKDWITDSTMNEVMQNFRPFVIHLNLRGCASLEWSSLKYIGECRNLQELNVSECFNITDAMIQSIVEGCNCLLYMNISSTLLTDLSLKELSRNCVNLQYLSVAYCYKLTDKGFQYLSVGRGCHNLIHLDLSGCTQVSVTGFSFISKACSFLKEIVINDLDQLSDNCVSALMSKCHHLTSISLVEARNLTDVGMTAIADVAKLKTFIIEGNKHVSHVSWKLLCCSSRSLRTLHVVDCLRMTDVGLKCLLSLRNLQTLDISLCTKVTDKGIQHLAESAWACKLQKLSVSHCCLITDSAVNVIGNKFVKLCHLDLSYCELLTDAALESLSCSTISSLDISGCNIQDEGLAALEEVPLKKMIVAECIDITDSGIENLCKYVAELEYVDVSGCLALSDQAIRAFVFYCRGLFTLKMGGCPKMTDMAVQCLSSGGQYLRELDVSGSLFTDRAIKYIERLCPPLSSVIMNDCNGISEAGAMRLQPHVQHWEYSNDQTNLWLR
ncbi:F-box and leucine-rich repeat protein 13-like [Entelurus aequoreus]|uniref:F-box and leucine-rich repeat protein 13-like n=1 Tax=Entelurus aequoreus TaxID=161455 RepID=UPI002B1D0500|nr:F-box and leucine-rich repeat protein 13-like [Entelurus aequoreus]